MAESCSARGGEFTGQGVKGRGEVEADELRVVVEAEKAWRDLRAGDGVDRREETREAGQDAGNPGDDGDNAEAVF